MTGLVKNGFELGLRSVLKPLAYAGVDPRCSQLPMPNLHASASVSDALGACGWWWSATLARTLLCLFLGFFSASASGSVATVCQAERRAAE